MAALECTKCRKTTAYMVPRKGLEGVTGFEGVNGFVVPGAIPPFVWDMLDGVLDWLKDALLDWLKDKTKSSDETYRVCKNCGYYEKL